MDFHEHTINHAIDNQSINRSIDKLDEQQKVLLAINNHLSRNVFSDAIVVLLQEEIQWKSFETHLCMYLQARAAAPFRPAPSPSSSGGYTITKWSFPGGIIASGDNPRKSNGVYPCTCDLFWRSFSQPQQVRLTAHTWVFLAISQTCPVSRWQSCRRQSIADCRSSRCRLPRCRTKSGTSWLKLTCFGANMWTCQDGIQNEDGCITGVM